MKKATEDPDLAAILQAYRIDREHNIFAELRRRSGCEYQDALDFPPPGDNGPKPSQVLFWPGCSLASFSPELTMAAMDYLKSRGLADALSVHCCGSLLRYAADQQTFAEYRNRLVDSLHAHGVSRIITSCPGCYRQLNKVCSGGELAGGDACAQDDIDTCGQVAAGAVNIPDKSRPNIEILALSEVLVQEGVQLPIGPGINLLAVHDSCPDRNFGVFAAGLRQLSQNCQQVEMAHHHKRSLCCGLGRLQAIKDPQGSNRLQSRREAEFQECGADLMLTACVSCTSAFAGRLPVAHYLELLLGTRIDWTAAFAQVAQVFDDCWPLQ